MTQHPIDITINKALLRAAIATASWRSRKGALKDARIKASDWIRTAHVAGASLREIGARLNMPLATVVRLEQEARYRADGQEGGR